MLYLAANGDPAASAERPRWDLESNTRRLRHLSRALSRPITSSIVSSGAVYDGLQRRRVAGDAGVAATAVRDLEAGLRAVPAVLLPSTAAACRATSTCASSAPTVRTKPARKITTRWLQALAAGQREFVIRGDGQNLIDFMYVDDAVDGFLALVKARRPAADRGLRVGRAGQRQRRGSHDGRDARRRRDGSPRRAGRRIHRVSFGRHDDARAIRRHAVDFVRRRAQAAVGISWQELTWQATPGR